MLIRAIGRYFCAGADLHGGRSEGGVLNRTGSAIREYHRLKMNGMHRIYDEMEPIEKPIVVAHHANCMGGGLELSLSCDFRLAAKSASYAFPEGKRQGGYCGVSRVSGSLTKIEGNVGRCHARDRV